MPKTMNIDHHIQLTLIKKLTESEKAVKYNDLKEDGIENSLFSYHLNKLLDRGMVTKTDAGYTLTVDGARWINDNGVTIQPKNAPRVFVALVVQKEDSSYLVGQRTGQFKETINDYMLPSIRYTNDVDLTVQVDQAIETFIPAGCSIEVLDYGFVQIKATYVDNAVMRNLFHLTFCKVKSFDLEADNYQWHTQGQIEEIEHPSATILRQLIAYTQDVSNQHETPTISG